MVRGDSNHGDGKSGLWDTDHGGRKPDHSDRRLKQRNAQHQKLKLQL
jgi:hypothetical protein